MPDSVHKLSSREEKQFVNDRSRFSQLWVIFSESNWIENLLFQKWFKIPGRATPMRLAMGLHTLIIPYSNPIQRSGRHSCLSLVLSKILLSGVFRSFRSFPEFWEIIDLPAGYPWNVIKSKDRNDTGHLKPREPLERRFWYAFEDPLRKACAEQIWSWEV